MGETPSRPWSVLAQQSGHVDHDVQISALDAFHEMDGRKNRYVGKVLERYRGEDAGDLKRSELDELVENWTCLNAPGRNERKINLKILMDEQLFQNVVMDEDLVQSVVMNGKFVKNFLMGAEIVPKVAMDLSFFSKLVDGTFYKPVIENCWKNVLRRMNRGSCRSEFQAEVPSL